MEWLDVGRGDAHSRDRFSHASTLYSHCCPGVVPRPQEGLGRTAQGVFPGDRIAHVVERWFFTLHLSLGVGLLCHF